MNLVLFNTYVKNYTNSDDFPWRIDVNVGDKKGGMTALYLAVKQKSPQLVEMLLEAGASLEAVCMGR